MINIKKCNEVSDSTIYQAFSRGFSDYILKITMDEETFINRFFGVEGNERELSFIAIDKQNAPIGVCLGGLKTNEKLKTLRCGGMSVIPEYRGKGVARQLMQNHLRLAKDLNCRQLFLEVIDGNDRAISFYKKFGYEKVYNLTYRKWRLTEGAIDGISQNALDCVQTVTYVELSELRNVDFSHLPWQNEFTYFKQLECSCYGIKNDNKIMAGMCVDPRKMYYLWVHPNYRLKGYAKALLNKAILDLKPESLLFTYANNESMHTFCNKMEMEYIGVNQLEMYRLV